MELSDVMETSPTAVTAVAAVAAGAGHGEPGCLHRSAHAAADKGRARVLGCGGGGEMAAAAACVGGAVLLCLTTTITRQTQTLQYTSILECLVCAQHH